MVVQLVLQQGRGCRERGASSVVADDGVVGHLIPVVGAFRRFFLDTRASRRVRITTLEVYGLGHIRQRRPGLERGPNIDRVRLFRPVEYIGEQFAAELATVYQVL